MNPGTTNVLRLSGKLAATLTLVGDVLKGVVPVWLARELHPSATVVSLCGFFAVLGHMYPVYFEFKGGKGVATALGAVTTLSWPSGLLIGAFWLLIAGLTRTSSLASLGAWLLAPLILYWLAPEYLSAMLLLSGFILYRHYPNIISLLQGKERNFR